MAEFLRIVWQKDIKTINETIAQLVQIEYSLIHELDGKPFVLSTKVTAKEEILLLLNHSPSNCLSKEQIKEQAPLLSPQSINGAISGLKEIREVRLTDNGEISITPIGLQRVMQEVVPKLTKN